MSSLGRNFVEVSGHGTQVLIFGHGLGVDARCWHRVAPSFNDEYRVVLYDLAGCGRSDRRHYKHDRYDSLHAHADDLLAICRTLGGDQVYYVGHSAGAMIGALAAIREPARFAKLVMIGGSPRYVDDPPYVGGLQPEQVTELVGALAADYSAWCEMMAPIVVNEPQGTQLADEMLGNFRRADPAITLQLAQVIFDSDHREDLQHVRCPTLVVQADKDPFVPNSVASYMTGRIPGARLELIRARGGHYPHLGAPSELRMALMAFLRAA
jgi:sigma-B regulation protein RsbQ